jgi:hypothetical protein
VDGLDRLFRPACRALADLRVRQRFSAKTGGQYQLCKAPFGPLRGKWCQSPAKKRCRTPICKLSWAIRAAAWLVRDRRACCRFALTHCSTSEFQQFRDRQNRGMTAFKK